MPLFTVDESLCKCPGACAAECPTGIIDYAGEGSVPKPKKGAGKLCINCGHCVSVCPTKAFSLATMPVDTLAPIDRKMLPSAEELEMLLTSRRSIRAYKDEALDEGEITPLIETVSYAPTGTNSQQVKWKVINSPDKVKHFASLVVDWMRHVRDSKGHPMLKMLPAIGLLVDVWDAGHDAILRGAPALVCTHAPKMYPAGHIDSTIALSTLELAAFSRGLGTCWAGFFTMAAANWKQINEELAIPEGNALTGAMMLGRPRFAYHRKPLRKKPEIDWI